MQYMLLIVIIHLAEIRILLKARKQAQSDEGLLRHLSVVLSNHKMVLLPYGLRMEHGRSNFKLFLISVSSKASCNVH